MSKQADPGDRSGSKVDDGPPKKKSPWLHAWHDPVAGFAAIDSNVRLVDLAGDGDHRLVVADQAKKLIIYKGTQRVSEPALLESPVALAVFYTDTSIPRTPVLAVAAGSYIYIYRNLKPYFKFSLPSVDIDRVEESIWEEAKDRGGGHRGGVQDTYNKLAAARDNGVCLSSTSVDFLSIEDEQERSDFLEALVGRNGGGGGNSGQSGGPPSLVQHTVVTCMETIKKTSEDDDAISSLVIGTENKQVLILDHHGSAIITKTKLPGIPVFLCVSGIFDAEWRVSVACRDARIYTIKGGDVRGAAVLLGQVIDLEAQPCALIRVDRSILVATTEQHITSFAATAGRGGNKKEFSVSLPAPVLAMEPMLIRRARVLSAYLVALKSGEVRVYKDKVLMDVLSLPGGGMCAEVMAMRFGKFGREDNSLVIVHKTGALTVKMLQRSAFNDTATTSVTGPPPEQDVPLNLPKKTKLFVEQTQRERDQAVDMHRLFQRDLGRLRLNTARAYVKIITQGHNMGVSRFGGGASLRLHAHIMGLGPRFKLRLDVQNEGVKSLLNVPLTLNYNTRLYAITTTGGGGASNNSSNNNNTTGADSLITIPLLLPGVPTKVEVGIRCLDPLAGAEPIRIMVINRKSCLPLLSAVVNMPVSEIDEED